MRGFFLCETINQTMLWQAKFEKGLRPPPFQIPIEGMIILAWDVD